MSQSKSTSRRLFQNACWLFLVIGLPLFIVLKVLGLRKWDLRIPLDYSGVDDIWQFALTKFLFESKWIFTTPLMGAPGVADWHYHAAAQTSALHSVFMLMLTPFFKDAIQLQQVYYVLNFSGICLTGFVACRLLNLARLPSLAVALLFTFNTFRFNWLIFSYLANYFMVPLAIVAVIWVYTGAFDERMGHGQRGLKGLGKSLSGLRTQRNFWLGLVFVGLTAASDGYYAFFTLLLLAFSLFVRTLKGGWKRPTTLIPGAVYLAAMAGVALALQVPLNAYKQSHLSEFYPNGVEDSALIKHPFEAEVYSSTLKLLVSPIPNHHIEPVAELGTWIVKTYADARKYPIGAAFVPLGTVGALLFLISLTYIVVPGLRRNAAAQRPADTLTPYSVDVPRHVVFDSLLSLTLFIFLFSIVGGINTLVALVYPTIRAYERFPLFLVFILYLGAAFFITEKLAHGSARVRAIGAGLTILVTVLALYDQIPAGALATNDKLKRTYLAEQSFVRGIEAELPKGSMVYQYPYSQYLSDNKHYGWGVFSHIRLYLHSKELRWSNGGAKNSPADEWNRRVSQLDLPALLTEAEGVGFAAMVIDRTVVKPAEFAALTLQLERLGYQVQNDEASRLAYVRLKATGYTIIHDASFTSIDKVKIVDRQNLQRARLSRDLDPTAFRKVVQDNPDLAEISMTSHPDAFTDPQVFVRGNGTQPVLPITDMKGTLLCNLQSDDAGDNVVTIRLSNQSGFDWNMGDGKFPMGIGMHVKGADGTVVRWDDGFRLPVTMYLQRGDTKTLQIPASTLRARTGVKATVTESVRLELVQDGNAWFNNIACDIRARP